MKTASRRAIVGDKKGVREYTKNERDEMLRRGHAVIEDDGEFHVLRELPSEDGEGARSGRRDMMKRLLDKVQTMDLGGRDFWSPKEGRNVVRILPPMGTMGYFFVEVGKHYKQKQTCPRISSDGGSPCPLCELNESMYASGEKELAAEFRASRAFWMNIVDRAGENRGPMIYTPGVTVFGAIVALVTDPDFGDIADPENGFDLKIDRAGSGTDTEYTVMPSRNPSPLGTPEQAEEWLAAAVDLQERVNGMILGYDDLIEKAGLQAYFESGEAEGGEEPEEDDDEAPSPPSARRMRR